jgi:hypothetical protein
MPSREGSPLHNLVHLLIRLSFIPLSAVVVTAFAATLPGRRQPMTRRARLGWLLAGACIGAVFLLSDGLYAPQT